MTNSFPSYYTLKNTSKLPTGTYYTDPYDHIKIIVQPNETLSSLMKKAISHREKSNIPIIDGVSLRALIETSLYEQLAPPLRPVYFVEQKSLPTTEQVFGFIKFLAASVNNKESIPLKVQEYRAKSCLACPLHQTNTPFEKSFLEKTVDKLASPHLEDQVEFPEKMLLTTCGACGCGLQSKIQQSLKSVIAAMGVNTLQKIVATIGPKAFNSCWMLKEAVENPTYASTIEGKARVASPASFEALNKFKLSPSSFKPTDKPPFIHPLNQT